MNDKPSFIDELTRRNVIRVAGLYLVGAWLLIQVANTVLPTFDVPSSALRGLVITLAAGFLSALIFSWASRTKADFRRSTVKLSNSFSVMT